MEVRPDLTEAARAWKIADNKKVAHDALQRYFDSKWPFYTYRGREILEYLRDAQEEAETRGSYQSGAVPLFYDLENDELFMGQIDVEGEWNEAYDFAREYQEGDRTIVIFSVY